MNLKVRIAGTPGTSSRHRSSPSTASWSSCPSPSSSRRSYRNSGFSSGLPDTGSLEVIVPESVPTTPVRRNIGASLYWTARVFSHTHKFGLGQIVWKWWFISKLNWSTVFVRWTLTSKLLAEFLLTSHLNWIWIGGRRGIIPILPYPTLPGLVSKSYSHEKNVVNMIRWIVKGHSVNVNFTVSNDKILA